MGRLTPAGTSTWLKTVLIASPSLIAACRLYRTRRGMGFRIRPLQVQSHKPLRSGIAGCSCLSVLPISQVVDADALQHANNGLVHARQGLFDGATGC